MKLFILLCKIIAFIVLSTLNFEYLINRESNTIVSILGVLLELAMLFFFFYTDIKKLLK